MSRRGSTFGVVAVLTVAALCVATALWLSSYQSPAFDEFDTSLAPDECGEASTSVPPCRDVVQGHLANLEPGQVLRIAPGRYEMGTVLVDGLAGTPEAPIEVTALDPSQPPELVGSLHLHSSDHVSLTHLDLVAAVDDLPALAMQCGVGWELRSSTVRGAIDSGAMSNFNISGNQPEGPKGRDGGETCPDEPRDFVVAENCFRDPYTDPELVDHPDLEVRRMRGFYHQVYASFEGSEGTGGRIERNRFQGHANGAGIKLGNGAHHTLGPWNVEVVGNAFLDGRNAVILHDDVRANRLADNLAIDIEGPTNAGEGVVFYGARLEDDSNTVAGTVAHGVGTLVGLGPEESGQLVDDGDNVVVAEADDDLDRDLPTAADGCVDPSALPWPD